MAEIHLEKGIILKIKKMMLLSGLAAVLCGFCFNNGQVRAAEYSSSQLRKYVVKTMNKNHLRGTIEVVKNGNAQRINVGYGYYKRRIKNSSKKLVYPVGSLQKMITAAIITQLIYQKKFTQNTKISRWYPLLKNSSKITVGQLMTHTSGINVGGTENSHGIKFSENGAVNWMIAKSNLTPSSAQNKFNYNNANYVLLAGIIRKVTGKSYAQNVKSRIIKPLNLHQTYLYSNIPGSKTDAISYLYHNGKNYQASAYANKYVVSQLLGAGNMFSTAADYYKIQEGMQNGKILTASEFNYLAHLKAKVNTYSGGFYLKKNGTLKLAYGNFGGTHFVNWMQLTTDNQNGIVMFLNQTYGSKNKIKGVGYKILKHIKTNTFVKR